jgi:hypothetical protein
MTADPARALSTSSTKGRACSGTSPLLHSLTPAPSRGISKTCHRSIHAPEMQTERKIHGKPFVDVIGARLAITCEIEFRQTRATLRIEVEKVGMGGSLSLLPNKNLEGPRGVFRKYACEHASERFHSPRCEGAAQKHVVCTLDKTTVTHVALPQDSTQFNALYKTCLCENSHAGPSPQAICGLSLCRPIVGRLPAVHVREQYLGMLGEVCY